MSFSYWGLLLLVLHKTVHRTSVVVSAVPRERRRVISLELLAAPQDAVGLLCFRGLLLVRVQLLVCQVLSCQAFFQSVSPQHVLLHRVIPCQVQHIIVFAFAGLHEVPQPVWVPLNMHTPTPEC